MVPFFPDYAAKHLRANSTIIGVIFALYPLSLFLTSLVAGMASARFGRVLVYIVGALLRGWKLGWEARALPRRRAIQHPPTPFTPQASSSSGAVLSASASATRWPP